MPRTICGVEIPGIYWHFVDIMWLVVYHDGLRALARTTPVPADEDSEEAVFRWVVIVGSAAASIIGLTLLTRPLFGAIWGVVLVFAGALHAYRWLASR